MQINTNASLSVPKMKIKEIVAGRGKRGESQPSVQPRKQISIKYYYAYVYRTQAASEYLADTQIHVRTHCTRLVDAVVLGIPMPMMTMPADDDDNDYDDNDDVDDIRRSVFFGSVQLWFGFCFGFGRQAL